MLDDLAATQPVGDDEVDELYLLFLRECMEKLSPSDRRMIDLSYIEELAAQQIADQLGRSRQSVCNSLSRVRQQLLECIEKRLAQKDHP